MSIVCVCSLAGTAACATCHNRQMPDVGTSTFTWSPPNNYQPDDDTMRRIAREVAQEVVREVMREMTGEKWSTS
jgi:hypothetical protein